MGMFVSWTSMLLFWIAQRIPTGKSDNAEHWLSHAMVVDRTGLGRCSECAISFSSSANCRNYQQRPWSMVVSSMVNQQFWSCRCQIKTKRAREEYGHGATQSCLGMMECECFGAEGHLLIQTLQCGQRRHSAGSTENLQQKMIHTGR